MELAEALIRESLHNAVKKYGIEGCEEKIKKLYRLMPKTRDIMLQWFNKIYKGKK